MPRFEFFACDRHLVIRPPRLEFHTKAVRETVYEVVIGGDLTDIQDAGVVEPGILQGGGIGLSHPARLPGQAHRVVHHGPILPRKLRKPIVPSQCPGNLAAPQQPTETRSVMVDSIEAVIHRGYRHGDHLSLHSREGGLAAHQVGIKLQMVLHRHRIQRVDADDVVQLTVRTPIPSIELFQKAGGVFIRYVGNVGHEFQNVGRAFRARRGKDVRNDRSRAMRPRPRTHRSTKPADIHILAVAGWVNAFYMTIITLTTVGYGEIIDLSGSPSGRLFTSFLIIVGMGGVFYFLTTATAFILEGQLSAKTRTLDQNAELFPEFVSAAQERLADRLALHAARLHRAHSMS